MTLRDESRDTHSASAGVTQEALDQRAAIRAARDRVVEAAVEWRKSRSNVQTRTEADLWDAVREYNTLTAKAKEGA